MTTATKLRQNIDAVRTVLENQDKKLSPQQIEIVKKYSGFGSCKELLFGTGPIETWEGASETSKKLFPLYKELYEVLDDNLTGKERKEVLSSLKESTLYAFYTPAVLPRVFYEVLHGYMSVKSLYEPSAGAGVFVQEAFPLPITEELTAYEKDLLTGKILKALYPEINVQIKGFEDSDPDEQDYDLVVSNIPFGAIPVYDPSITEKAMVTKIHNYFFAKGLEKLREGGVLAYLVTSAFLDTVTNRSAREYLFNRADFISLTVMPDNLMKEAGTEAPSHFLVVRKNSSKTGLSAEEQLLCVSENEQIWNGKAMVTVSRNKYVAANDTEIVLGSMRVGTNQYGKPNIEVLWSGQIDEIAESFRNVLEKDFRQRFVMKFWNGKEMPIGPVIKISDEGKFEWKPSIPVDQELPPWEELPKHIQLPEDKEHTCDDCGTAIWDLSEKLCPECLLAHTEEGWPDDEEYEQEIEEEAKTQEEDVPWNEDDSVHDKEVYDQQNQEYTQGYQDDVATDEKLLQEEPKEKKVSQREKDMLGDFQQIVDVFTELEQQKDI